MREVLGHDPPHRKLLILGKIEKHPDNYENLIPGEDPITAEIYKLTDKELCKLVLWEKKYHLETMDTKLGKVYVFKLNKG